MALENAGFRWNVFIKRPRSISAGSGWAGIHGQYDSLSETVYKDIISCPGLQYCHPEYDCYKQHKDPPVPGVRNRGPANRISASAEHLFQFFIFLMRDQCIPLGAFQTYDVCPASIRGNVCDPVEVDDVGFVAAEEDRRVQTRFSFSK